MKKPRHLHLTRRESQIMEILHRRQRAAIEEIRAELPDAPSPSSVRKLLEIMIERGLLRREYDGPRYMYFPAARPEDASRSALQQVVRTFFNDSPGSAMAALLDITDQPLSARVSTSGPAAQAVPRTRRQVMSALLIAVVLKGSILMTVAAAAIVAHVSRVLATRSLLLWTLTVVGLLLLPVFRLASELGGSPCRSLRLTRAPAYR